MQYKNTNKINPRQYAFKHAI